MTEAEKTYNRLDQLNREYDFDYGLVQYETPTKIREKGIEMLEQLANGPQGTGQESLINEIVETIAKSTSKLTPRERASRGLFVRIRMEQHAKELADKVLVLANIHSKEAREILIQEATK